MDPNNPTPPQTPTTGETTSPQNPEPVVNPASTAATIPDQPLQASADRPTKRPYLIAGLSLVGIGIVVAATLYTVNALQTQKQYQPTEAAMPQTTTLPSPTPQLTTEEQELQALDFQDQQLQDDFEEIDTSLEQL